MSDLTALQVQEQRLADKLASTPTTAKQVTLFLRREFGMAEDIELVKGKGYFYFSGGNAPLWGDTSVCVYRLTELTLGQWANEYNTLSSAYTA